VTAIAVSLTAVAVLPKGKQRNFSLVPITLRRIAMDKHTLPEIGFIRLPEVLKVYPVSKSTWWAGVKEGRFPKPVKLGPKMTAWRVEDIRELIAAQRA
jgi:prophage regulatory protein